MNKYQMALDRMVCHICNSRNGIYVRDGRASEDMNTLQELINNYQDCKNQLCLHCGNYKQEHLGACKGCKFSK